MFNYYQRVASLNKDLDKILDKIIAHSNAWVNQTGQAAPLSCFLQKDANRVAL